MSLNFSFDKIVDKSVLFEDGVIPGPDETQKLRVETHNIIVNCYNLGMSKITEKNVDEYWDRYVTAMKYNNTPEEFWGFDKQDVINHIGLTTNVTQVTKKRFKEVYGPKS